jgi:hypothetical protein
MLPASQSSHDNPNNEVGINSVPEHISKVKSLSPYLPELCDKDDKTCYTSRLYMDAISDEEPSSTLSKTEAVVMSEVADFVQTRHCDEFWAPRNAQPERVSFGPLHCCILTGLVASHRKSDLVSDQGPSYPSAHAHKRC